MNVCFFCLRTLDRHRDVIDQHHVVPKRFFRRGTNPNRGNRVPACVGCHQSVHRRYDNPNLTWPYFAVAMAQCNWWYGLLA